MKRNHETMTTAQLAERLCRPALWISRIRKKFGLPNLDRYPRCYESFLRKIRDLRNLGISEERLETLWGIEKKLIETLHLDLESGELSLIEGCSAEIDPDRRLLLSNADLGVPPMAREVQAGLDFQSRPKELFGGREMGEDALRLFGEYHVIFQEVRETIEREIKVLKASQHWAKSVGFPPRHL